jgi:ABC-type uncharacterized transport system permease subunit
MHDKILLITVACYLLAWVFLYMALKKNSDRNRMLAAILVFAGVLIHAFAQSQHWLSTSPPQLSLLNVLSLCSLVTVSIPLATLPFKNNIFDASMVALPLAALILIAEVFLDAPSLAITQDSMGITVHIITSIVAFGVLSIAGVYAVFVALIDHLLRQHTFNKLVQALPALEVLEKLLFHLIAVGFVILTISLITGLIFINDLFGQHLAHKTLLSVFAWMVFATLLWGRWKRGWRGRVAVRMTLAGIALLLLSYFGSKLILEVLLERSWHE